MTINTDILTDKADLFAAQLNVAFQLLKKLKKM